MINKELPSIYSCKDGVTEDMSVQNKKELVTIVIEVGDTKEAIVVYEGDSANKLAEAFANTHNLSSEMKAKLKEHIQNSINEAIQDSFKEINVSTIRKSRNGFLQANTLTNRSHLVNIKSTTTANFGERMYRKGIKDREEREKRNEKIRKERELEAQHWSFRPAINSLSKNMMRFIISDKATDRLTKKNEKIIEKMEKIKAYKALEEELQCPFKPNINKYNKKAQSKNFTLGIESTNSIFNIKDKFKFLFEDAKKRKTHKERLEKIVKDEECTFHPNIEPSQRVVERPQIRKPKHTSPSIIQMERPAHLTHKAAYKQKYRKHICVYKEEINKSFVQERSNKLVNDKKELSFIKIFDALDKDGNGKISSTSISLLSKVCAKSRCSKTDIRDYRTFTL